jgi:NADPH2:quinone reductase
MPKRSTAARAIPVPSGLDDLQAAALPLQGMTARYLTSEIRPLGPGDTVLIHAGAGGVGHLAVQMAKRAGAVVFATCSTEAKAARVRNLGADHVIRYDEVGFADEVSREPAGVGSTWRSTGSAGRRSSTPSAPRASAGT